MSVGFAGGYDSDIEDEKTNEEHSTDRYPSSKWFANPFQTSQYELSFPQHPGEPHVHKLAAGPSSYVELWGGEDVSTHPGQTYSDFPDLDAAGVPYFFTSTLARSHFPPLVPRE